jgi:hypothetical protein
MSKPADGVLAIEKPVSARSTRLRGLSVTPTVELDQAVRHLQDLARGRLAAPTDQRRRRGKSRS